MTTDIPDTRATTIDPLTRLAIQHGTDKWGPHFYTPVYHQLFAHLRDKPVRLLEIGIGGFSFLTVGGASLAMWAEYFPHGDIVGIDIAKKRLDLGPRVTCYQGSQDDAGFLQEISRRHGPFDIIIDDGSHDPRHVVASFTTLFPLLANGGLYVIEDVQSTFWPGYGGSLEGGGTMAIARDVLKSLHHAEIRIVQPDWQMPETFRNVRSFHAHHNIFAIEKGDNDEPSNFDYRLDNPHAQHAIRVIRNELAQVPTAHGYAQLVGIYVAAKEMTTAWSILEDALRTWPGHPHLLATGFAAGLASKDTGKQQEYLLIMGEQEPDNLALQTKLRELAGTSSGPT